MRATSGRRVSTPGREAWAAERAGKKKADEGKREARRRYEKNRRTLGRLAAG